MKSSRCRWVLNYENNWFMCHKANSWRHIAIPFVTPGGSVGLRNPNPGMASGTFNAYTVRYILSKHMHSFSFFILNIKFWSKPTFKMEISVTVRIQTWGWFDDIFAVLFIWSAPHPLLYAQCFDSHWEKQMYNTAICENIKINFKINFIHFFTYF